MAAQADEEVVVPAVDEEVSEPKPNGGAAEGETAASKKKKKKKKKKKSDTGASNPGCSWGTPTVRSVGGGAGPFSCTHAVGCLHSRWDGVTTPKGDAMEEGGSDHSGEEDEPADGEGAKKKEKKKKKSKGSGGPKQTNPPSIPIFDLYPNRDYPHGEIMDYVDE